VRAALFLWAVAGCMPPPVAAVDRWLSAFAEEDRAAVIAWTAEADRPLMAAALVARAEAPTSTPSLALPPRPLRHRVLEVADRAPKRQVIAVEMTVKNPLPSASQRVGQMLPGVPETRPLRRRFLSVEEQDGWRVKLDLARVLERAAVAEALLEAVGRGALAEVERRLASELPAPPDDGDGQPDKDRLRDEIEARLHRARGTATSTKTR
jgi:hypothetical protein